MTLAHHRSATTVGGNLLTPWLKARKWPRRTRVLLANFLWITALVAVCLLPRIPIGPNYHRFADNRNFLLIPNALDVVSNLPFVVVGLWGLIWLAQRRSRLAFIDPRERIPYLIFFAGVALTGAGSCWYHLAPSNNRLPWDLLPMTSSFLSLVVVTWMERVDLRIGFLALFPVLAFGVGSVVWWYLTARHGRDDYRFYLFVQFFAPVQLACIFALFPPRYTGMRYLIEAFALYLAAKLFESFDSQIFDWRHIVSGHTLKHVTAAVACLRILRMLQVRQVMQGAPQHLRTEQNAQPAQDR
jgi:hypothetical protein